MTAVFSINPPKFTNREIEKYLMPVFELSGKSKELYSDRDQNFLIKSDLGQKYILKISNPAEPKEILELQNEATLFIHSKDSDLGVPLQIGEIKEFEKDGQKYFIRLVDYLEGQFLKDARMSDSDIEKLGAFIGRLSQSLAGFSHPAADREFEWDVRATELIKSRLDNLESESGNKIVNHFLNEFAQNISPHELRMTVIHNDGNDHNILVDEQGETTGIIDFGDMVYSYQVTEPAVCMAYVGLEKDDPFMPMAHVMKGYHSCFPLTDSELKSALYLSCVRLCISVTMSAWRMNLFPEIKYLSVSQKPAWDLLRKLENEDLKEWSQKLLDFVKY